MLLEFQQVQFELDSASFFELDGTGNTLHLDLQKNRMLQLRTLNYCREYFFCFDYYRYDFGIEYSMSVFGIFIVVLLQLFVLFYCSYFYFRDGCIFNNKNKTVFGKQKRERQC